MPGFANALLITAAVGLLVIRRTKPQRVRAAKRWWLAPAVLAYCSLRGPGFIDVHHRCTSIALLGADLCVGVAMSAAWTRTNHVWTEPDGRVWSRGTRATAGVWAAGTASRLGLVGIALLIGIHQGAGALLLALAVSLLVRTGFRELRVRAVRPAPALTAAVR
ncbi:DUF1453 domain-containing protein [Streptomyces longispororuber]|uniref:DUF1453 domain-containing protein n=1 Tax=Streptomyces longispororuber TaxID=68230 RepID=A0A918Z2C8_9ACTN|nr:DUF1453 domain-containing protein [Streptomyces longispororuber]GHE34991.1 DUF1453 domain-containing protein [Streptomyces longispororuber]